MTIAVPLFKKDELASFREEKEDNITISSRSFPERGVFVVNKTARVILGLCDGDRSLSSIYAQFAEGFKQPVSLEQAREDVNDVVKKLDKLGLIEWTTGVNPFAEENKRDSWEGPSGIRYQVCAEYDLDTIMTFLHEFGLGEESAKSVYKPQLLPVANSLTQYLEVAVRNKLFEYYEMFVLGYKDEQPLALISVISSTPRTPLRTATLGLVLIKPDVSDVYQVANEAIDFATERINRYCIGENVKIRSQLAKDDEGYDDQKSLISAMGFDMQIALKDELGKGRHLELWDRWID